MIIHNQKPNSCPNGTKKCNRTPALQADMR